ncbi:hypothetical protein pmac_cds_377 [Pandoravirus macleodensis]|uniref:Uncharacterized protein n=1 Tax=Pandoravirus macleodensis TaxID=2107707 RepID=A0A2U7UFC2_9VIRU|nr:hypothetical protein pmac_cds_377 [Pandoravirus macleodensis]AVK77065.1 hypothetical protein pmac_cds_377 [Pandoravirus macleodensis]
MQLRAAPVLLSRDMATTTSGPASGPFGASPPERRQTGEAPSWDEVRLWASRNGFGTPAGLARFMLWVSRQSDAGRDPRATMLALALARGPCAPLEDDAAYRGGELSFADVWSAANATAFMGALTGSRLLAQTRLPPPRQSSSGPVPAGTWADPLTDPLYQYPDGTFTPYWPPVRPAFEAYLRQSRLDFLDHAPDRDSHQAILDECQSPSVLGSLAYGVPMVTGDMIDAQIAALQEAHAQKGVYTGDLPAVPSHPVLSGPHVFAAARTRDVMAPVVVMISTNPRRPVAEALQGGQVFARYSPGDAEIDPRTTLRLSGAVSGSGSRSVPLWAVRAVLADMLNAAQAGQAGRFGLHQVPPGALTSDARGARVLARDQLPRWTLSRLLGLGTHTYAGAYDIDDLFAAAQAHATDASARILRRLNNSDDRGKSLMALAARAYRGPVGTGSLPAEVDAFAAPYVAARACAADASDTDLARLQSAARLLGVDPDSFASRAALCAELAEILDPSPGTTS